MGLFGGGTTTSNSTTNSQSGSTSNAYSAPVINPSVMENAGRYYDIWGALTGKDAQGNYTSDAATWLAQNQGMFANPANAVQQQAYDNAANLGGWQNGINVSNNLAAAAIGAPVPQANQTLANTVLANAPTAPTASLFNGVTQGPVSTVGPVTFSGASMVPSAQASASQANVSGYNAPQINGTALAGAGGVSAQQAGPAAQAGLTQANAATLGPAAQATATNTGPAAQASANGYSVAGLNPAQGYSAQGYQAPTLGQAAQAGTTLGQASSVLDGDLSRYLNPANDAYVNSTLANLDRQNAIDQAAYKAQGARNGAFGGSRFGVGESNLLAEQGFNRAQTEAGLRKSAYDSAIDLAKYDASNRQSTNLANTADLNATARSNTSEQNQFGLKGADLAARANEFTAGAQNEAARFGADANNQFGLARFGAQNDAARFGADASNAASLFNTGETNRLAETNARLGQEANLFNTGAQNDVAKTNAGFQQDTGIFNAGQANQTNQFNAGQTNETARTNASLGTQANIAAGNNATQVGIANANSLNQVARDNAGFAADAGRFNADAANQAARDFANNQTQVSQFNTGQVNDRSAKIADLTQQAGIFNAGQNSRAAEFNANAQNDRSAQNAQFAQQAGMFNAGEQNDLNSLVYGTQAGINQSNAGALNQGNIFNAGQANQTEQFNAGQRGDAQQRALQGASLFSGNANMAGNLQQGDISAQLSAGNNIYDIAKANNMAPAQLMEFLRQGVDPALMETISGKSVTTNDFGTQFSNTNGTQTQPGGGLFGSALGLASLFL